MNTNFAAMTSGILNCLEKLTLRKDKKSQIKIDQQYPGHENALIKSVLAPKVFTGSK